MLRLSKPLQVKYIPQITGIGIKDYNITQVAAQKEAITTQQEKQ